MRTCVTGALNRNRASFLRLKVLPNLACACAQFPNFDDVHPFYADLMNVLYDKDHYKLALGQMNTARHLVDKYAAPPAFASLSLFLSLPPPLHLGLASPPPHLLLMSPAAC